MKAKKRKQRNKAWAEFQATYQVSDEALLLIRQVHGRVAELLRSVPDPPPVSVDDWIRQRHRQWTETRAQAASQAAQPPSPKKQKTKKKLQFDPAWAKAKKLCRLNQGDIEMAKRLGMTPKSLMKNIPSPSQLWKAPVKDWIHQLYAKRFPEPKAGSRPKKAEPPPADVSSQDVPF